MMMHEPMSTGTTTTYSITSNINRNKMAKNLMKIKKCRPKKCFMVAMVFGPGDFRCVVLFDLLLCIAGDWWGGILFGIEHDNDVIDICIMYVRLNLTYIIHVLFYTTRNSNSY